MDVAAALQDDTVDGAAARDGLTGVERAALRAMLSAIIFCYVFYLLAQAVSDHAEIAGVIGTYTGLAPGSVAGSAATLTWKMFARLFPPE
jgi:hypothetical protein